jgi:serine/threonine protein kinase
LEDGQRLLVGDPDSMSQWEIIEEEVTDFGRKGKVRNRGTNEIARMHEFSQMPLEDFDILEGNMQILELCQSPSVLRLYAFRRIRSKEVFITYTQFCETTMDQVSLEGWTMEQRHLVLFGLIKALEFLHSKNVVHGSVTLFDICLNDQNQPILAGFQQARFADDATAVVDPNNILRVYCAPEVLTGNPLSPAADIFAFGVVMCEVLLGDRLSIEQMDFVRTGRMLPLPRLPIYAPYWPLLEGCWHLNPLDRLSAATLAAELSSAKFASTLATPLVSAYRQIFHMTIAP